MRVVSAATFLYVIVTAFVLYGSMPDTVTQQAVTFDESKRREGEEIFRYDTFGDEQLWTDVLRMHEVLPSVDPATALAVGLKVDVDALPASVIAALRAGQVPRRASRQFLESDVALPRGIDLLHYLVGFGGDRR